MKKRVTLYIPAKILKESKLFAVENDTSLSAVVTEALEEKIKKK